MSQEDLCHSTSELSEFEGEWEEPILSSSLLNPSLISNVTAEIGSQDLGSDIRVIESQDRESESGEIDSQDRESDSREIDSQGNKLDESSFFKKIPELARFFKKKRIGPGKVEISCLSCSKLMKTRQLDRLSYHTAKCPLVTVEDKEFLSKKMNDNMASMKGSRNKRTNELWTEFLVQNNVPINSVDSSSFDQFRAYAVSRWRPATRQQISSIYLPSLSSRLKAEFIRKTRDPRPIYISVEFDHWRDARTRSLLGITMTYHEGIRYFCDLVDASLEGHSAAVIVEQLIKSLSFIDPRHINSIISDSATSCKAAREQFVKDPRFSHVIQHRCLPHLMNRVGHYATNDKNMKAALKWASAVASVVANSPSIKAKLRLAKLPMVHSFCATRWYSNVDMVESLLVAKEVIVEELKSSRVAENRELVALEGPWKAIEQTLQVVGPLARCIAIIERRDGRLGEAFRAILNLGKELFEEDWTDTFKLSTITAYLTYVNPDKLDNSEFGLLVAAYALDQRYSLDYLTEDAKELALESIIKIALNSGSSIRTIKDSISPEYADYINQASSLQSHHRKISAEDWWTLKCDSRGLKPVALRLANLRSSSANIERTFSSLKYIQGNNRLNLSLQTFVDIARIKTSNHHSWKKSTENSSDTIMDLQLSQSSQTANSSSGDNGDEKDDDGEIIEPFVANHRPDLLPVECKRHYIKFCRYVDFTIINRSHVEEPQIESQERRNVDQTIIDEVLKSFRSQRENRKSSMS